MSPNYPSARRGTSRILPEQFDLEGATTLGGLNRLHRFLQHVGLEREMRQRFGGAKAAWAEWRLDQVVRVFLDIAFAGLPRLYHYAELEAEPLLCTLHRTLDILRADGRKREVLARLDSGFEGEDALAVLERRGVGYVVKMRATAGVAHAASTRRETAWRTLELEHV